MSCFTGFSVLIRNTNVDNGFDSPVTADSDSDDIREEFEAKDSINEWADLWCTVCRLGLGVLRAAPPVDLFFPSGPGDSPKTRKCNHHHWEHI